MKSYLAVVAILLMAFFSASAYDFSDYYNFLYDVNEKGERVICGAEEKEFATPVDIPSPSECTSLTIPDDVMEITRGALHDFPVKTLIISDSSAELNAAAGLASGYLEYLYLGRNTNCSFGFSEGGKLEMGSNVTEIADTQFRYAVYLSSQNITWSQSLTKIGGAAFEACHSLDKVSLPSSVVELGDNCFKDCHNMSEIELPEKLQKIGNCCFELCSALKGVTLPNNLQTIGGAAFNECSSIKEISIPASVEVLGYDAFKDCNALEYLSIEDSEKPMLWENSIYDTWSWANISPFYLDPIKEVYLGRDILHNVLIYSAPAEYQYDTRLFYYIDTVKKITFGDNVSAIFKDMFSGRTNLETVILGKNIKEIGNRAFGGCHSLKEIILPDGLHSIERIGACAFMDCESLNEINIPEGVASIGDGAFQNCKAASSIYIPTTVSKIPEYCFENCESVKSLTIPENVDTISFHAFNNLLSLKDLHIADSKNSLTILNYENDYAFGSSFENCPVEEIYIGRNIVTNTESYTFGVVGLYGDGCIQAGSLRKVYVGDCVTELKDGFYGNENLTEVRLSPNLKLIGSGCFAKCGLKKIDFPEGLEIIGGGAFEYCRNLEQINLPKSLKEIGSYAFEECNSVKELIVPGNVKRIGDCSFFYVPLKSLVLENGVEHIGVSAFTGEFATPTGDFGNQCIDKIIVNSPIPPICDDSENYGRKNPFAAGCYENSELIVPAGSEELYATAEVWENFRHITSGVYQVEQENFGIELKDGKIFFNNKPESLPIKVFNAQGILIHSGIDSEICLPAKGAFIIRIGNQSMKVMY